MSSRHDPAPSLARAIILRAVAPAVTELLGAVREVVVQIAAREYDRWAAARDKAAAKRNAKR